MSVNHDVGMSCFQWRASNRLWPRLQDYATVGKCTSQTADLTPYSTQSDLFLVPFGLPSRILNL